MAQKLIFDTSRPYGLNFYFDLAMRFASKTYIKKPPRPKNCPIVVTRYLNIETRSIGLIIGKGGTTIKKIEVQCNVKIIIQAKKEIII
jgi:hypothetical protein